MPLKSLGFALQAYVDRAITCPRLTSVCAHDSGKPAHCPRHPNNMALYIYIYTVYTVDTVYTYTHIHVFTYLSIYMCSPLAIVEHG